MATGRSKGAAGKARKGGASKKTGAVKAGAASKRGAAKKGGAKVTLDAGLVHKFHQHLRDGLINSAAVMAGENRPPEPGPYATVELDANTAQRLSQTLRAGLVSSSAVMFADDADPGAAGKGKKKGGK